MRRPQLAVLLAVTLSCGGATQQHAEDKDDDEELFSNRPDYKPKSFVVEVHGRGRPVIFIPGLGCPGDVWQATVDHLGDDVQSHVLTLAGFAGVAPIRPPLAAKVRKELVRYIRSHRLESPIVVGHSLGGFIAYWLAATNPDLIGGIVVVDAGPALSADAEDARLLRNAWAQSGNEELPQQVRTIYSMMTTKPRRMAPFIDTIAKSDRQTIGDAIYEYIKTDITDQLHAIRAPTLIVLSDGGLQRRYRKQTEAIEDREIVVLPKTRHFVMFDDPDGFYAALDKFLAAH